MQHPAQGLTPSIFYHVEDGPRKKKRCWIYITPSRVGHPGFACPSFVRRLDLSSAKTAFEPRRCGSDGINAAFFDGHVQSLRVDYHEQKDCLKNEGFTGPAVKPQFYYPTGSVVRDPSGLHSSHMPVGTRLP